MTLLAAQAVSKRFGSLVAVDSVDLAVGPGEVVGLLGANGAGKTTLIRLALGLLAPTTGSCALFGAPPDRAGRRRIGYMPQGLGLYDDLTVAENLAFVERTFGVGPGRQSDPALADPDLAAVRDRLVGSLPLGLRRRVAFASALGHRPDLLILDEPTSGVDPLARARLWETIRSAAEAGAGVLVTTHAMVDASSCDRLVVMVDGRVAAAGTVSQIVGDTTAVEVRAADWSTAFAVLDRAGLPLALVGRAIRAPDADPARVRGLLETAGLADASVAVVAATFEEAFVALSTGGR
jgi:ABC-2 type transport system ATP-binding protein/ribosome-dependent ATPase